MMNKILRKRGISILVLALTIIVMLIIASVIVITANNTNIIGNAKNAADKTSSKEITEAAQTAYNRAYKEFYVEQNANPTTVQFKQRVLEILGEDGITEEDLTNNKLVIKTTGIKELSSVKSYATRNEDGYVTENVTYSGEQYNYNNPIIPKGFKTVNSGSAIWGTSNSWEYGLIIEDRFGNQYVWVPVDGTTITMNRYVGYMNMVLQTGDYSKIGINTSGSTTYLLTEPLLYSTTSAETWEIEEYQAMSTSVSTYKGFYIARYEASQDSSGTKAATKSGTGIYPWANIQWGSGLTTIGTTGAVYYARKMTTDYSYETVVSTLIYGAQYDAALKFIELYGVKDTTYKSNGTGKGWYNDVSGSVVGPVGYYSVNNIFDMAGNVYEWTMEAYSNTGRIRRGGPYNGTASYYPASYRNTFTANNKQTYIGFRTALYIK